MTDMTDIVIANGQSKFDRPRPTTNDRNTINDANQRLAATSAQLSSSSTYLPTAHEPWTSFLNASPSRNVIGPGLPSPIGRPSILVTEITSAALPVKKHSSET